MSSKLSNFSGDQPQNQRRLRKANAVQYEKNVMSNRKQQSARKDAKFDAEQWKNFSNDYLWDNLTGAQKNENKLNEGITGYKYEPTA